MTHPRSRKVCIAQSELVKCPVALEASAGALLLLLAAQHTEEAPHDSLKHEKSQGGQSVPH